jgi:hypothetical protein
MKKVSLTLLVLFYSSLSMAQAMQFLICYGISDKPENHDYIDLAIRIDEDNKISVAPWFYFFEGPLDRTFGRREEGLGMIASGEVSHPDDFEFIPTRSTKAGIIKLKLQELSPDFWSHFGTVDYRAYNNARVRQLDLRCYELNQTDYMGTYNIYRNSDNLRYFNMTRVLP